MENPLNDYNVMLLCLEGVRYAFYRRTVSATLNTIDAIIYVLENMEHNDGKYNFIARLIVEIERTFDFEEKLESNYIWNEFLQDLKEQENGFYK